jgi:hypothetical protein
MMRRRLGDATSGVVTFVLLNPDMVFFFSVDGAVGGACGGAMRQRRSDDRGYCG